MVVSGGAGKWQVAALTLLTVVASEGAAAAAPDDALRFDWVRQGRSAQLRCPESRELEAQVRRRLHAGVPEARVEGTIRRVAQGWQADIIVALAGDQPARRTLVGAPVAGADGGCAAVSDASAVAIAILLDPTAELRPVVSTATVSSISPSEVVRIAIREDGNADTQDAM